jgi:hypothetical protein
MPPKKMKNRKESGKSPNSSATDSIIINSAKSSGSATSVVKSDLTNRPQNFNIVQKPPKQIGNQIYWVKLSYGYQTTVGSSLPTESNFYFTLNSFQGYNNFTSAFDQYCMYSVTASVLPQLVTSTTGNVVCYSAIDYDNNNTIGTGIQSYSSFNSTVLNNSDSLIRFVKPCISTVLSGSSGVGVFGSGIGRAWVDCAATSIPHYGLRFYFLSTIGGTATINFEFSAVIGFRNSI